MNNAHRGVTGPRPSCMFERSVMLKKEETTPGINYGLPRCILILLSPSSHPTHRDAGVHVQ